MTPDSRQQSCHWPAVRAFGHRQDVMIEQLVSLYSLSARNAAMAWHLLTQRSIAAHLNPAPDSSAAKPEDKLAAKPAISHA